MIKFIKKIINLVFCFFIMTLFSAQAFAIDNVQLESSHKSKEREIYIADNNSIEQLFSVLGGIIHKSFIVSSEAGRKRVSGHFDMHRPYDLLKLLSSRMGLIWYNDGSAIYVYDNSEIKSEMVRLSSVPFNRIVNYLKVTGLYDAQFPPRSDKFSDAFYISGPPVYVDLVVAAAKYIDDAYSSPDGKKIIVRIIKLKNSFVTDRQYMQRDVPITIPGVSTVLNDLLNSVYMANGAFLNGAQVTVDKGIISKNASGQYHPFWSSPSTSNNTKNDSNEQSQSLLHNQYGKKMSIVAYPDTNSLLLEGTQRQINFVEDLVNAMDIPKKQIQLSLWIIDISKDDINKIGIQWEASGTFAHSGINFNTTSLTPDNSIHFLADVHALAQKGNAQVVSHPELLTQENIPALFDNNTSFYTKLVGERVTSLEKITYGTMISVLPRLAEEGRYTEMILNIQDGGVNDPSSLVDNLPIVNNTQISTEARVPLHYSLLVGGYSRDDNTQHNDGIPFLMDIPFLGKLFSYSYTDHKKMVRLFLIQPTLIEDGDTWQGLHEDDSILGRSSAGSSITLKSTVAMLRQYINKQPTGAQ